MEEELNYLSEKIEELDNRIDILDKWFDSSKRRKEGDTLKITELKKELETLESILSILTITQLS